MRETAESLHDSFEPCSEMGARRLAARIKDFWIARGYRGITTGIRQMAVPKQKRRADNTVIFGVVSNIGGDGYPPKR